MGNQLNPEPQANTDQVQSATANSAALDTTSKPVLDWQDGLPYSAVFGDVYFSREDGLAETRHVFLQHNQLSERWQGLAQDHFTIAETGFGTGLNFLCAWQLWQQSAPAHARLHFVSVEKFPLSHAELSQALALWPALAEQAQALLAQYQQICTGWHRLVFDQGRVQLTLIIGDALESLQQLRGKVDAWFLDGFAPSRNPEMWQPALFAAMARLSHQGDTLQRTSFATFTSAGLVKRGLAAAGFTVNKVPGHGRKREMLCGSFGPEAAPAPLSEKQRPNDKRAIVIGGGIAGAASAAALAERGWQVTLIEQEPELASQASGNPLGVLYPKLTRQDVPLGRLSLLAYLHSLRWLQRLQLDTKDHARCGMLQLAFDEAEYERGQAILQRQLPEELVHWVDQQQASALAGVTMDYPALYFPQAGWVRPQAYCQALCAHENIQLLLGSKVLRLQRGSDLASTGEHGLWQAYGEHGLLAEAPVVIIANANAARELAPNAQLPLEPVRGQITRLHAPESGPSLRTLLCTDGYISPEIAGEYCLGATFSPKDEGTEHRTIDDASNLDLLARMAPALHEQLQHQVITGRAALRCTSPDYLPLVGPLLDHLKLQAHPPRYNADPVSSLPWQPGLYVNTGHGSKGLTTAPLAAEMLASSICAEPAPVDASLLAALDPNRFVLRKLGLKRMVQGLACHEHGLTKLA